MTLLIDSPDDDGFLTQGLDEIAKRCRKNWTSKLKSCIALPCCRRSSRLVPVRATSRNACCCNWMYCLAPRRGAIGAAYRADYPDLLAGKDYNRLKRLLQCSDAETACGTGCHSTLEPAARAQFSESDTRLVADDCAASQRSGLPAQSCGNAAIAGEPDVCRHSQPSSRQWRQLASQLQEAKWLIKNVQQRFPIPSCAYRRDR